MNIKKIIIVLGEPNSVFSEILGKYFTKRKKLKKKIIIIGNYKLFKQQLNILGFKIKVDRIENIFEAKFNKLNLIDIEFKYNKVFSKLSSKSNDYIKKSFDVALKILSKEKDAVLINGPISKKNFLKSKYLGITEYLSKRTKSKKEVMLIYNKDFSVSPITTHLPIKLVSKAINEKKIVGNVIAINNFYKKVLNKKPKFAILGLNPHCESILKNNEEKKFIIPAIKKIKQKNISISGPFSADTFFLKDNREKFDIAIGMYHDQVLTPIKTIYNFNAINITIGLPFIRISPDHGPNISMVGKKKSDATSIACAMDFINKLKISAN